VGFRIEVGFTPSPSVILGDSFMVNLLSDSSSTTLSTTSETTSGVPGIFLWLKTPQCDSECRELWRNVRNFAYLTSDAEGVNVLTPEKLEDEYGLSVDFEVMSCRALLGGIELSNILNDLHLACGFNPRSMEMAGYFGYDAIELFPIGKSTLTHKVAQELTINICFRRCLDLCSATRHISNS
jgi:hypothetical protein